MKAEEWVNYRSPFDDDGSKFVYQDHRNWIHWREQYAKTGQRQYLYDMLSVVTADNPPRAPEPVVYRRWGPIDITVVIGALVTVLGVASLFGGWRADVWVTIFLVGIFLIGRKKS